MRRKRLVWQLFPSYLVVTLISLLAVTLYAAHSWRQFHLEQTAADLTVRARLAESQLRGQLSPQAGPQVDEWCKRLGKISSSRLTVILVSGKVLGDSEEDPPRMDNHGDRPEVKEALQGRVGVSTRYSFTLGHHMMYVAIPYREGGQVVAVVRAALPMIAIRQALQELYLKIALAALGIALVVAGLSLIISRRLSLPLEDLTRGAQRFARGELERKLPIPDSDELGSLAQAMNHMAGQLEDRINALVSQGQLQEAVLSSMVEGVMVLDDEGHLITLNRAAAKLLGLTPQAVQNLNVQDMLRDPELQWFVNRTLSAREPIEGEVVLKGDGQRILQVHGTSLRDSQGKTLGNLVVFHDITHLRRLESTRRDFVANVSHELKTPITSIKGFVETLLGGALQEPKEAEKFLRIIARHSDRLNEIIDDLLTLARIEQDAEKRHIFLTTGKIKGVLQSAIQVCEGKAAARGITVHLTCPDDLKAQVNGPLLEQAMVNLIDNAIKFSAPGSPVKVEAQRAGVEVVISVQDQGCGIPKEHLDRIFERFYRVDAGRSRKAGGTGLGLAIVKHIAQAHGGRVSVESTPGQGTVFFLHLLPD